MTQILPCLPLVLIILNSFHILFTYDFEHLIVDYCQLLKRVIFYLLNTIAKFVLMLLQ